MQKIPMQKNAKKEEKRKGVKSRKSGKKSNIRSKQKN